MQDTSLSCSVHEMFSEVARREGERVAISSGDRMLCYAQLEQESNRLANYLLRCGSQPGERLVVLHQDRCEVIVALLASLKAGLICVPLDERLPIRRVEEIVAWTQPGWIWTDEAQWERVREALAGSGSQARVVGRAQEGLAGLPDVEAYASFQQRESPGRVRQGEEASVLFFTSGTTGQPKGIVGQLKGIDHFIRWELRTLGVQAGVRVSQLTSPGFDAFLRDVLVPLCGGGTVCVPESREEVQSGSGLERYVREQGVEVLHLVPSLWRTLLGVGRAVEEKEGLGALRYVLLAGEAVQTGDVRRWYEGYGRQVELVNLYGPSETTMTKFFYFIQPSDVERQYIPVGKPMDDTTGLVLDNRGKICPPGKIGEIFIRTPYRTLGYYRQPDLTAKVFLPNPFSSDSSDLLYKTGDLGRLLPDGNLEVLGRRDHQVKIRGVRVELEEVEGSLLGLEDVQEAVVIATEERTGEHSLTAYVVLEPTGSVQHLRAQLAERLPAGLIPSRFLQLERLPRTLTGKVDRQALPEPTRAGLGLADSYVAPRTPLEELLVQIWQEVLHLPRVGVQDHFFALGGHSLLATQVLARMHTVLGAEVTLHAFFEEPTIEGMSREVEAVLRHQPVDQPAAPRRRPRGAESPLSFGQQRLWFLEQLAPGNRAYLIQGVRRLRGRLVWWAVEASLVALEQRHESLRTTFRQREGEPVQVIGPVRGARWVMLDLSGLAAEHREREARQQVEQEGRVGCDLEEGPLWRVRVVRLGEQEQVLVVTQHHIITDGWSSQLWYREWSKLYQEKVTGKEEEWEELALQYADYALWQREWLTEERRERQLGYWRGQLEGAEQLELPLDRRRGSRQSFVGAVQRGWVGEELKEGLERLSQREGVTLFMTLLAAFEVLLARVSGQTDICVGTLVANRPWTELEGLIGFFANTVVLRTSLSSDLAFLDLLHQVRQVVLDAYTNQDIPFEQLVETLLPERDPSRSPLFQVAFGLQQQSPVIEKLEGLEWGGMDIEQSKARFDLALNVTVEPDGLYYEAEYNRDIFDAETIQRLLEHWQTVLAGIVARPQTTLSMLPLLSQPELQRLLIDWNQTACAVPDMKPLHILFAEQARRTPDAIAITLEEHSLSYAELERYGNGVAATLQALGVPLQSPIALYMERSLEGLMALLGILKAGCVLVLLDVSSPIARLQSILEETQAPVLLTRHDFRDQPPVAGITVLCLDQWWGAGEQMWATTSDDLLQADGAAYILYTSGSTGRPKGVVVSHQAIVNRLWWGVADIHLQADDRALQIASWSFDIALWELFGPWMVGATLVMFSAQVVKEPRSLLRHLQEEAVTVIHVVPSLLNVLLQEPDCAQCQDIRCLLCGGEAVSAELVRQVFSVLPVPLHQFYGPTEASISVTCWIGTPETASERVSIGRPIANTQIYLVDPSGQPVIQGAAGEVWIGGMGLAWGYFGQPDRTAERFVPDPFSNLPGARLYRTGDIARYYSDGSLEFAGRIDTQVKIRGHRIEPGEIEAWIAEHPAVREGVVVIHEDTEGEKMLVAYYCAKTLSDEVSLEEQLRQYVRERLPEYMVPAFWVSMEQLPLTTTGKVDRRALSIRELPSEEQVYEQHLSLSPVMEVLAEIWRKILKHQHIDLHDNFFGLGGHSLLAVRLIARIRTVLHVDLSLPTLFEAPTLAELGAQVEQALRDESTGEVPPLLPVPRTQFLPLSLAQQRLWFLHQLDPENCAYLISRAQRLSGRLHVRALERSFTALQTRHESLRTVFHGHENRIGQIILPPGNFYLPIIDLQGLAPARREQEVLSLAYQEARRPCYLEKGPLLRASLLRLHRHEHLLLLTIHHIISDHWSDAILVHEIIALYQSFIDGRPALLPPLPIQYADFAVWQQNWLQDVELESLLKYWRKKLDGMTPLELPTDYPRTLARSMQGARRSRVLPAALGASLLQLGQQEDVTLFMLLLAAFQAFLARYCNQTDISVSTPFANRAYIELEGLIGFFVNILVLRTDFTSNPSFIDILGRVRETTLEAYVHGNMPYERLIDELRHLSTMHASPFPASFVLHQNAEVREDLPMPDGLVLSGVGVERPMAEQDLILTMVNGTSGFYCEIAYQTDLFKAETIDRWLDSWQNMLESIVREPQTMLADLSLLSEKEHEQLVYRAIASQSTSSPEPLCWQHMLEAQALQQPDTLALINEQGECLSYEVLNRKANQLAWYLRQSGVGPEVLVGVLLQRSLDTVITLLAVAKAGGGSVPCDPSYPLTRLQQMLEDASVAVLLCDSAHQELARSLGGASQLLCLTDLQETLANQPQDNPGENGLIESIAYLIFTSGSTGRPKGVVVSHRGLHNLMQSQAEHFGVRNGSRVLQFASPSFDAAIAEIVVTLGAGGSLYLWSGEQWTIGEKLGEMMTRWGITSVTLPPSILAILLEQEWPDLETLVVAGEVCSDELAECWEKGRKFCNAYGPTEATVCVSIEEYQRAERPVGIGHALPQVSVYIVEEGGQLAPVGVVGELHVGGVGLARGYMGNADLTAEKFVPHPWSKQGGERLYRTGDLVRWKADGQLEYRGRKDQQVKVRGYRIELGEIEAHLKRHPLVQEAVATVREDVPGDQRIVAYVIGTQIMTLDTEQELRDYLSDCLPMFMLPSHLVSLESLPLLPNGKIDRKALPAPDLSSEDETDEAEADTPVLELLAGIWSEILDYEPVNPNDHFFEMGGHSLLVTQFVTRIQKILQVDIPVWRIFETPTLIKLVPMVEAALRERQGIEFSPPTSVVRSENLPLSFAQQRLWFLDQLDAGNLTYLAPNGLRMRGALHIVALERAFQELVRRHEILRTTFQLKDAQPTQLIHPPRPFCLPVIDLRGLTSSSAREGEAQRLHAQEATYPCDLAKGPLLRTSLLWLNTDEYVLLLTMHHIISDGWSMQVLTREITLLYQAFVARKPSPLTPLTLQYADFAIWQRNWLKDGVLQKQLDYWKEQLREASELPVPTDYPRPLIQSHRGANYSFVLSSGLLAELRALSRKEGVTLFMTLLAAFQTLLYRFSGQTDITVGTDMAGRMHIETEALLGFFVNLLALRTDLSGAPTFRQLLRRVRVTTLGAYTHQDVPFEMLVEQLRLARSMDRVPLVQTLFVLQNVPVATQQLPGITLESFSHGSVNAKFDLALFMSEHGEELSGSLVYCVDLFKPGTIATLMQRFEVLLGSMIQQPDTSIDVLELYTEDEKAHMSQREAELYAIGNRSLHAGRGEEINLENLPIRQVKQKRQ